MNKDPLVFCLANYANDFVTRDIGKRLRAELLAFANSSTADQLIIIDATGVTIMTPSFVDEFFGRTTADLGLQQFKSRFQIVGTDTSTQSLVNNVVRNRLIMHKREVAPAKGPLDSY